MVYCEGMVGVESLVWMLTEVKSGKESLPLNCSQTLMD